MTYLILMIQFYKILKMRQVAIMEIFFDTEFTGLFKDTELISIGLVTSKNNKFYA